MVAVEVMVVIQEAVVVKEEKVAMVVVGMEEMVEMVIKDNGDFCGT
jgi:signal transduction histidine kinase